MPGSLEVRLGEYLVGTLTNIPGDYTIFSFDENYLADSTRPVLGQHFLTALGEPRRIIPRTHTVAPPFFANLLPEEGSLLRTLLSQQHGINPARDFPLLSALGGDLPGALIVRPLNMNDEEQATPRAHSPSKEKPLRFSLAGVQLKFSAHFARKRLTIPLEGLGGSWIVKLPTNAFARLPENEFAMMRFARACGFNVPDISLVELDDISGLPHALPNLREDEPRKAYAVARFDRKADGIRTHVEDFNQIAGQAPARKYESRNYEWIGNVVQTLCPPEDTNEFIARLIFGIGIGNNDMHLKNWAIIYPDGKNARLAPMYDFVCTGAYYPNQELALPLAGEKRFSRMTLERLRVFANAARLSARQVTTVAKETTERMLAEWPLMKESIEDRAVIRAVERHFEKVPLMNLRVPSSGVSTIIVRPFAC